VDRESIELEPEPDWRKDPTGRHQYRMWQDGWTERVSDFGVRAVDPYTGSSTAPNAPDGDGTAPATLETILGPTPARDHRSHRRSSTSTPVKTIGGLAVLAGALLAGIGTLVPVFDDIRSYTVNYIDLPGYDDRGIWVAIVAGVVVLAGLALLRRTRSRVPAVMALIVSTGLLVLVVRDWREVDDALTKFGGPGLGLVSGLTVCLIGASIAVLGAVVAVVGRR
jgi:hypothetical protein